MDNLQLFGSSVKNQRVSHWPAESCCRRLEELKGLGQVLMKHEKERNTEMQESHQG